MAQPEFGSLTGTAPNLVYSPDADFDGTDRFSFRASDGTHQSNIAIVTINVTPQNDAPTWLSPPTLEVDQGGYPLVFSLASLFADVDDSIAQLTLSILDNSNSALVTASITDLGDLELDFNESLRGNAVLQLKAADPDGLFDVGELQIHVNAPPAPTIPAGVPIEVNDCESSTVLSVYDFFQDPEEPDDALEYAVTNITNPDIFDEVALDPETGELTLLYAGVSGTSEITLRAWDSYGAVGTNYFFVTTYCDDPPPVTATILKVEFIPSDAFDQTTISAENKARYGVLDPNSNPNGDVTGDDPQNIQRGAWIQPGFKGGDRFFPDAIAAASTVGRNVVRVRATVQGVAIGSAVWLRSFDVDDPSDAQYDARYRADIDPNDLGNDNRGRMGSVHAPANSAAPDRSGRTLAGSGRLRAVNEGNVFGEWADSGKAVKAIVKPRTNAAGQLVNASGGVVTDPRTPS